MNAQLPSAALFSRRPILRTTIRSYFIALTFGVLVPVLAFAGFLLWSNIESERESTEERLLSLARALIQATDQEMRSAIAVLESLRQSQELLDGNLAAFERLARRVHGEHSHWNGIVLTRPDGQQLMNLAAQPGQPLPNIAHYEVIQAALTGRSAVSELLRGRVLNVALVGLDVPVYVDGQIKYVLGLSIPASYFQRLLERFPIPQGWTIGLIDHKDVIVAQSVDPNEGVGRAAAEVWRGHHEQERVVYGLGRDVPIAGAYSRSGFSNWRALVSVPTAVLAATERRLFDAFLLGGICLLAVSLLLAYSVGRRIVRPIQSLASAAKTYVRGEASELPLWSPLAEVDDLADALRQAARLEQSAEEARRRAEAELQEARKIESLGQLTGGLAHDFNNLLAIIVGNVGLAKKRIDVQDHLTHQYLDRALQGADRGAELTQRLLAYARRQELRPRDVNIAELVGDMLNLIRRTLGGEIAVETQFADALPMVRVDTNQLELALLNLMVNARDAMPTGGTITLSARAEDVVAENPLRLQPGRYVVLSVKDRGIGMDAKTLARATEPFFTTKGPGKGTGLGLSAVQGLAAQSGGALQLLSLPSRGTTAEVWLPQAMGGDGRTPELRTGSTPSIPPQDVLVVDDDALVAACTADMLDVLGHRAIVAASGAHALEILSEKHGAIDVVISDYAMPGMNGADLLDEIHLRWPGVRMLLVTGHADLPATRQQPVLRKPFRQEELAVALSKLWAVTEMAHAGT